MKIVKIKIYKFDDLSEDGQDSAIHNYVDINVDHDWWQSTYDDATNIGLEITGFDLHKHIITYNLCSNIGEIAGTIINEHGHGCDSYKLAINYYRDRNFRRRNRHKSLDFSCYCYTEEAFSHALVEDYLCDLSNDYDYLTSEHSIKETLINNNYDFTANGEIY